MIILALAFKLQLFGHGVGNLSPSEFITVVLTGSLFVILGTIVRLYQYRLSQEIRQRIQETAERTLEATVENSNRIIESELQAQQKVLDARIDGGRDKT
jgi:hypothetical protein